MKIIITIVLALCVLLGRCAVQESVDVNEPEPVTAAGLEDDAWQQSVALTFDSFDGGGPTYSIMIDDPEIVKYERLTEYNSPDHEMMDGAGYDVTFVFTGLEPGTTTMTISARSPIGDNYDIEYSVTVNEELEIFVEETGSVEVNY